MSRQTEPRAHHYLPQCFLKGFAVVTKKRKVIWVYTKSEPYRKSTVANEAHERKGLRRVANGEQLFFPSMSKIGQTSHSPRPSLTRMGEHLPIARLLAVAVDDELIFTLEEFKHLKACSECFLVWTEFIIESQGRDEEKKKANQAIGRVLQFQSRKLVQQRIFKLDH